MNEDELNINETLSNENCRENFGMILARNQCAKRIPFCNVAKSS